MVAQYVNSGVMAEPAPYRELGARLRELRKRLKLTQDEIAPRLGISPSYVSALENGRYQPTTDVLEAYERVAGADYNELAERAGHLKRRRDVEWTPPPDKLDVLRRFADYSREQLERGERVLRVIFLEGEPPKRVADDAGEYDGDPDEPKSQP